jgi:ribosomal protein S18 acetylase RimI-like enzyme
MTCSQHLSLLDIKIFNIFGGLEAPHIIAQRHAMAYNEPVPLTVRSINAATDVLVRSFAADPGLLFVLPDINERNRLNATLARAMLRFVLRCGSPLVTSETVRGVALWFPPDAAPPTHVDLLETGMADLPTLIGKEPMARFKLLIGQLDTFHPEYAPEPHWYLAMLGVDPEWQRQGIGEALMRPVLKSADRIGNPCYLESPTMANTRYYQRRGFRVVGEIDIPDSEVHVWFMRREPGA